MLRERIAERKSSNIPSPSSSIFFCSFFTDIENREREEDGVWLGYIYINGIIYIYIYMGVYNIYVYNTGLTTSQV